MATSRPTFLGIASAPQGGVDRSHGVVRIREERGAIEGYITSFRVMNKFR